MMTPFHLVLAGGMLLTGSINTLTTKAADNICSTNRYGYSVGFNHPFVQAAGMFIGEMLCLFAFYAIKCRARMTGQKMDEAKPFSPFIFLLPALCDMTATSTMYLGLGLTDASIFQMLRGSVVIFTTILSVLFLKRKQRAHNWIGVALVLAGTAIVGAQGKVCPTQDSGGCSQLVTGATGNGATVGNILIIVAQLIVAVQMVVEEKFIAGYNVPALQVVGWEGIFGFSVLSLVLVIMYYAIPQPAFLCANTVAQQFNGTVLPPTQNVCAHFEDTWDAFVQMGNAPGIPGALVGNIISIAFFNFFGVSVTKHINAATRMVLDSLRTMVIWFFSLGIKWESFCWVQVIGFVVLLTGTVVYNALVKIPGLNYEDPKDADAKTAPVADLEDGHTSLLGADGSVNGGGAADGSAAGLSATGGLVTFEALVSTPTMGRPAMLKGK